jgi:DNA-directed RNA polymerase subunit A'
MAWNLPMMVDKIKFGIFSPEDIRKMSVAQIITADTYDEDGLPIDSGLMDGRLGTIEPSRRCKTCGNRVGECIGHFGQIELARPVIHEGFAKLIHRVLRSICRSCSRIILSDEQIAHYSARMAEYEKQHHNLSENIVKEIVKVAMKSKQCPHCNSKILKLKLEKPTTYYEQTEEGNLRLTPVDIRSRLENIPDADCKLLGIRSEVARPEWTVLVVLPVAPVAVRPSITLESGVRSEDDLTHKLVDVIRINQRLRENIDAGAPQLIVEDLWELLQYHVTTYFNNEVSGIPPARHRSGRALRTLTQRLKGKEGRFRSNLSGKRVDFSARTVISPDPYLSINEVGVPETLAQILTVPEYVTEWRIEAIKELVKNGPANHPGANYIIRPDKRRVDLRFVKDLESVAATLEPGFIVERHLSDGDIVLFNRQPSLHRMSIMAHNVRVMPYRTFRLNLNVCPPYNADFDGDEMNLHVPQSEEARAEAKTLMQVQEQILSPRYGGPIIGAIQDFISGSYLLTRKDVLLTRPEVAQLLMAGGYSGKFPDPVITKPHAIWTGKQVYSLFIPNDINLSLKSKICTLDPQLCSMKGKVQCIRENCKTDAWVVIRRGEIVTGVIDEKAIGAQVSDSLFHRIVKDNGPAAGRIFLDSITGLIVFWLSKIGISIGNNNVDLPVEAVNRINKILDAVDEDVKGLVVQFNKGYIEPLPGRSVEETLEMKILGKLSEQRDAAGAIATDYLTMDNYAVVMAKTGARGKLLNLSQMAATVGQQAVRGARISRGFSDRTLPHFQKGDRTSSARGFVRHSYLAGLTPTEFFFHAMGGREGLVDTAVRTSTSGYLQRRLVNALQDVKVEYDDTVRDADGRIIQFRYGDDGVDPAKSDHGKPVNLRIIIEKVMSKVMK